MPADSYSQILRLRLQATGNNTNTWGSLLNEAAFQLIEDAVSGLTQVTMASTDVTLSTSNGATDQARMAVLNLIGTPVGALNLIVPTGLTKFYLVWNTCGQTITVKTLAGTGIAVPNGALQYVFCNGTNVLAVQASPLGAATDASSLGGYAAADYPRLDSPNSFTAAQAVTFYNLTDGSTVTLNALLGNNFFLGIGGNRTLSITNPTDGQAIELWVKQDGAGGRTLGWPGNVLFEAGATGVLSTGANDLDRFQLTYNAALGLWYARQASQSSGSAVTVVLEGTLLNASLFELAGRPGSATTINFTIPEGTLVYSTNPATPALDMTRFPSGTVINLTNLGYILGCGGNGGEGGTICDIQSGSYHIQSGINGQDGFPGGDAIKAPGAGITVNITNASGFIWGGGGGAGGGGAADTGGYNSGGCGGGGGGGTGGGIGGGRGRVSVGNRLGAIASVAGTGGGTGPTGAAGTGGAGAGATAGGSGAAGGNGGDWGTAGGAGVAATIPNEGVNPGVGGGAGKAVNLNGGSVNFVSGSGGPNVKGSVS